jgi:hypothetical protein
MVFSIASMGALWCTPVQGPEVSHADNTVLLQKSHEIEEKLLNTESPIPIHLESFEGNNSLRGDVYGIIEHPFDDVRSVLCVPDTWCDIASLHFNIKACTCSSLRNKWLLTFYSGRKFYQPPEGTFQLKYNYRVIEQRSEHLKISLTAERGPLNTNDYRIELEAVPLNGDRTLIRFSYAYCYGLLARVAMKGYLATLGRGKRGFSIVNTDSRGDPVYAGGTRGAIERNAVGYYFAIQAYMDTLAIPEEERFERRISRWYDLTDRHRQQLFEMSKQDYLTYKKLERRNQIMLQRGLSRNHASAVLR